MTTHRRARCQHCGVRYYWQPSGGGAPQDDNPYHCLDCSAVIREALSSVPLRVEKIWVDAGPEFPSAPVIHEEEMIRINEMRSEGKLVGRRIAAPLFDLKNPSNRNEVGFARRNETLCRYSFWTDDPEETSVVVIPMEKDLVTGDTVPWEDIKRWK